MRAPTYSDPTRPATPLEASLAPVTGRRQWRGVILMDGRCVTYYLAKKMSFMSYSNKNLRTTRRLEEEASFHLLAVRISLENRIRNVTEEIEIISRSYNIYFFFFFNVEFIIRGAKTYAHSTH